MFKAAAKSRVEVKTDFPTSKYGFNPSPMLWGGALVVVCIPRCSLWCGASWWHCRQSDENYLVMDHRQENVSLWVSPCASVRRLPSCSRSWTNPSPPSPSFCLLVPRCGLPRHRLVGMEREGESRFCLLATKKKLNILDANPQTWSIIRTEPLWLASVSLGELQAVALLYRRGMRAFP